MTTPESVVMMLQEFVARERARRDAIGAGGQQVNGCAPSINVSALHELECMIRDAPDVAANYTSCLEYAHLALTGRIRLQNEADIEAAFRAGCAFGLDADDTEKGYGKRLIDEAWADYQRQVGG